MAKMTQDDWIKRLKHLAMNRVTYYDNSFPSNCGEINRDGSISFDCIGLVKSVINEPDIAYKTSPAGYFVKPNQKIPDTTEIGILNLCSDISYSFNNLTAGEYLYYAGGGHAGVYVGSFDDGGECNVIECTPAFGGGVTTSWVDGSGRRFNHKGGYQVGRWEAHGKLSRYIDYTSEGWVKWINGKWYYVVNGNIDYSYNGVAQNENGWWKITNGEVDFNFTGLAQNTHGWWYCKDGKVDFTKDSVVQNENGWWKVTGGKVDFTFKGLADNENGWWYLSGGKVDFTYNGIVQNHLGWWKVTDGKVAFDYNGLADNENGWWMLQGGKVDFNYNGLGINNNGVWVLADGKVQFDYNGEYQFSGSTYNIEGGKVK